MSHPAAEPITVLLAERFGLGPFSYRALLYTLEAMRQGVPPSYRFRLTEPDEDTVELLPEPTRGRWGLRVDGSDDLDEALAELVAKIPAVPPPARRFTLLRRSSTLDT